MRWLAGRPHGLSCKGCLVIRQLEPAKVPQSCDDCGKTDLHDENLEAWELFQCFPGLVRLEGRTAMLDLAAAAWIIDQAGIKDKLLAMRQLEAIRQGLNGQHG